MSLIPSDTYINQLTATLEYQKSQLKLHEELIVAYTNAAEANKQVIRSIETTIAAQQQHYPPQQQQHFPPQQHRVNNQQQQQQQHHHQLQQRQQHPQQQQQSLEEQPKKQRKSKKHKERNSNSFANNGHEIIQSARSSVSNEYKPFKPFTANFADDIKDTISATNNLNIADDTRNAYENVFNFGQKMDRNIADDRRSAYESALNFGQRMERNVESSLLVDNAAFGGDSLTRQSSSIDNEVKECISDVVNDISYPTFESMNLRFELLKGIKKYGFNEPTQLQRTVIIPCIEGANAIVEGKRATGKSSAYSIALLQKIDTKLKECQCLVLFPRRTLAQDAHKQIRAIAIYMNVNCELFLGVPSSFKNNNSYRNNAPSQRFDIHDDIDKLRNGAQIAVATPGRVKDLIERRALNFANIKTIVLDNCEGFFEDSHFNYQLIKVFNALSKDTQTLFFGDQIKFDLLEFANQYVNNYRIIKDKNEDLNLMMRNVQRNKHYYLFAEPKDRFSYVLLLMATFTKQIVLFTDDSRSAEELEEKLIKHNTKLANINTYKIAKLHRTMPKKRQTDIINDFIAGNSQVIVTYPDSLRGISMNNFPLVINYYMPTLPEDYAKRIGEQTTSISLLTSERDQHYKINIEQHYNVNFVDFASYLVPKK